MHPGSAPTLILIVAVFGDGAFGRQLGGESGTVVMELMLL